MRSGEKRRRAEGRGMRSEGPSSAVPRRERAVVEDSRDAAL